MIKDHFMNVSVTKQLQLLLVQGREKVGS